MLRYDGLVWTAVEATWDAANRTLTTGPTDPIGEWTFVWTGTASAGPRLTIGRPGPGVIVLRWPASGANARLEASPGLGAAGGWVELSVSPELDGDAWRVTLPAADEVRFFRLRE